MNIFKKIYCRTVQGVFRCALPFLPYRDPKILKDAGEVAAALRENGKRKPLIVTGKTVRKLPLFTELVTALQEGGFEYEIFDGSVPNPTTDVVLAAAGRYRETGCDCLIAFGGGSPMDCAKGVGARLAKPKKPLLKLGGVLKVKRKIPLLIAVPTTAGSGSETTLACVLVDSQTGRKFAISDFRLIPDYAVLNGETIFSLPFSLAATTGMDALTHAVEAYIGRGGNRATRKDALGAIKLILENLENFCTAEERDRETADNLLYASHLAGRAFSKAYVGYVHAMAHPLGGKYDVPHGLANAVLLPIVLREYGSAVSEKLWQIAVFCRLCDKSARRQEGAEALIATVEDMEGRLHIPKTIGALQEGDIEELAALAEREANPLYPVPVLWTKRKIESVYRKILKKE